MKHQVFSPFSEVFTLGKIILWIIFGDNFLWFDFGEILGEGVF